jgi:hypothetical protein
LNFTSLERTALEPASGTQVSSSEALGVEDNNSAQFASLDDDDEDPATVRPRCDAMGSNKPMLAASRSGKEPAAANVGIKVGK